MCEIAVLVLGAFAGSFVILSCFDGVCGVTSMPVFM